MKSRAKPFGGQHGPMYKAKPRGEATRISTMWIEFRGMGLRPMELGGRLSEAGLEYRLHLPKRNQQSDAPAGDITRISRVSFHAARSGAILA